MAGRPKAVMPLRCGRHMMAGALLLGTLLCMVGCSREQEDMSATPASDEHGPQMMSAPSDTLLPVPEEYQEGKKHFEALCARCHGRTGGGTDAGPPFVHKIYEPSHHADITFMRAAAEGVRAHHWDFGDMPKVTEATPDDVATIIPYVRWLQRRAGIT